ncbi:MAG: hypothetical protein KIH69_006240 [Anaerolineae bacterium]|nr:hypothetical protein [Anaerolineae bacterium]
MKPQKPKRTSQPRTRYEVSNIFSGFNRPGGPPGPLSTPRWVLVLFVGLLGVLGLLISRWVFAEQMSIAEVKVIEPYTLSAGNIQQATMDLRNRSVIILNLEDMWDTVTQRKTSTVQQATHRLREQPGIKDAHIFCGNVSMRLCEVHIDPNPPIGVFQTGVANQPAVMYLDDRGGVWTGQYAAAMEMLKGETGLLNITLEKDTTLPAAGSTEFRDKPYILRALTELRQLQPDMRNYVYSNKTGWAFDNSQKTRIIVGFAERPNIIAEKLNLAEQIRNDRNSKGVTPKIIDVRYLETPSYR